MLIGVKRKLRVVKEGGILKKELISDKTVNLIGQSFTLVVNILRK